MRNLFLLVLAAAALLLMVPAANAQAQSETPKVEIGAHYSHLRLRDFGTGDHGVGFRLTINVTDAFGIEGEVNTITKENTMKKLSLLALLMVLSLPLTASAQEGAPKAEIFGGYSFIRVSLGEGLDTVTGHGFNLSVAGNITKNFGIVGEFARYSKSDQLGDVFNDPSLNPIDVDANLQTYLFGPRFTVRTGKGEPFFHGLIGAVRGSAESSIVGLTQQNSGYAFAYALGGGLDVKVHNNFAIRVAQLDYLQARVDGEGVNSFRYSVGVVIRLGNR